MAIEHSSESRIPVPGAPVFTRDGASLGVVKEVEDAYFKVDAPRARDYWLSCEFVRAHSPASVELDFDAEVLEVYKLEGPGPGFTQSPALDEATDAFDSPSEKGTKRENMEAGYPESPDTGRRQSH